MGIEENFGVEIIYVIFLGVTYFNYFNFSRYACSLLTEDMKQIVITLDSPDIAALENQGDREAAIAKVQILKYKTLIFFILFFRQ